MRRDRAAALADLLTGAPAAGRPADQDSPALGPHRRAVHDTALLIPTLAPSLQGHVDPTARFGRALTEFLDRLENHPGRSSRYRW